MSASDAGDKLRIHIVGVGGQGALSAAKFIGEAALLTGREVTVAQLHGMSQRGGSVECPVIIGDSASSHIPNGSADVLLALEPLEALRALPKLSAHTRAVVSTGTIVPFTLAAQGKSYPPVEQILAQIRAATPELHAIDGPGLAHQTGAPRTLNVVMLGALAGLGLLPFDGETLWSAVQRRCPPRFVEANRQAFELGQQAIVATPQAG